MSCGGRVRRWIRTYRDEREVENRPYDVELPVETFDAWWRNFDDWGILLTPRRLELGDENLPMKLKIQFVAVPSAAPFVRIAIELISVGYSCDYQHFSRHY